MSRMSAHQEIEKVRYTDLLNKEHGGKTVVGITGNIASGKSSVAKYLQNQGYFVIDADVLTNDLYLYDEEFKQKIINIFTTKVLTNDQLDKKKIGRIVFNDQEKLHELERIIHPLVLYKAKELIVNTKHNLIFFEVPLLFESGYNKFCDYIIMVAINEGLQVSRLMHRNKLTRNEALHRINLQQRQETKIKMSDYVIYNNTDLVDLYHQVDKVIVDLKEKIKQKII